MSDLLHLLTGERAIIWAGAICTLAIYTFLYRENVVYRVFEHFYLGLAVGYGLFLIVSEVLIPKWWVPMWDQGQWWWAFALVGGGMFYFIYSQKHNWISRLAFGIVMGLAVGFMFQDFAGNNFPKIVASLKPLWPHHSYAVAAGTAASIAPHTPQASLSVSGALNNAVFVFVLLTVLSYFFFSYDYNKHKAAGGSARIGRWMLMFAFGAMFGSTVMARMSLLIGRVWFLLADWLRVVH
ncbi:MAG: hypothetical protein IT209_06285 [Armatimonadetes bacterium]|nr:hypothetical protein [Armatimonadota bacterium]